MEYEEAFDFNINGMQYCVYNHHYIETFTTRVKLNIKLLKSRQKNHLAKTSFSKDTSNDNN